MFNILEIMYIYGLCPTFNITSVTHAISIICIDIILILLFTIRISRRKYLGWPKYLKYNNIYSSLYDWFYSDVISIVPIKKQKFFLFFFILFLFMLISNISGLIPFSDTITSYWLVNLYVALTTQIGITIVGFYYNKFSFAKLFLPGGIPWSISLILVPTEILSYISRIFSLAIRLFANMFAGHTMLKIVCCFSWAALYIIPSGFFFFFFPISLFFLVLVLEILVSLLQAYVFVTLILIYLKINLSSH